MNPTRGDGAAEDPAQVQTVGDIDSSFSYPRVPVRVDDFGVHLGTSFRF